MNLLSTPGFQVLQRSLDAASLRQRVIANNIANVDTPYFKRSEVRFEELLANELKEASAPAFAAYRTNPKHFQLTQETAGVTPQIVQDNSTAMNNSQNNVDIDLEMALLAENQLYYNTMIAQVNHEIKHLRTAIKGGA